MNTIGWTLPWGATEIMQLFPSRGRLSTRVNKAENDDATVLEPEELESDVA
jgi:hypothetical protein